MNENPCYLIMPAYLCSKPHMPH